MKYCSKCGNAMEDNMSFCNSCGTPANTADASRAYEQKCLDKLATGLKHERLCYKIVGIVYTVLAAVIIVASLFMLITGVAVAGNEADYVIEYDGYEYYIEDEEAAATVAVGVAFSAIGAVYIFCGIVFLGVGIVNLVLSGKVGKYRQNIYTDCTPGADHAGSVGSIVLAAFFNEIALIFVIINFVFMKKNAATFEAIKANQKLN